MRFSYNGDSGTVTTPNLGLKKGTYFIKVERDYPNTYSKDYKFKVNFKKAANWEVESNDNKKTANKMKSGVKYYGTIFRDYLYSNSEKDYYKIVMEKPGRVKLSFHFSKYSTNDEWFLTLKNATEDTTYISNSIKGNENSTFTTPYIGLPKGIYYVEVEAYGNSGQIYDLKAEWAYTNAWEKEKNDNKDLANPIKLNTKYYGSIEKSYSYDYYKFTLPSNGYVSIPITYDGMKKGDLMFRVYKGDGTTEAFSILTNKESKQKSAPAVGLPKGTYYIKVESWTGWTSNTYSFSVNYKKSEFWEKEPNNGFGASTTIKPNTKYYGSMHRFDLNDYYKFTLNKADVVSVTFGHEIFPNDWDVAIIASDKKTKMFSYTVAGLADKIVTTDKVSLKPGTYYLRVSSLDDELPYNVTLNTGQKNKITIKNAELYGFEQTKPYTGKPVTQYPKIVVKGRTLVRGTDYTIRFLNNTNPGTAYMIVTAKGNYIGSGAKSFKIGGLERIYGNSRYDTANKIANRVKSLSGGGKFRSIVVAFGENFPDALGGAYLAKAKGAPIILTSSSKQANTLAYIKQNLAAGGTVYILGGVNAVPADFSTKLKSAGIKYVRRGGRSRYDTNALTLSAAGIKNKDLIVCTGMEFPDALIASATGRPILIVNPKADLTPSQKDLLKKNKVKSITIIGDTNRIPAKIANQLKSLTKVTPTRIIAKNRYDLSIKVAEKYFKSPKSVVIATGKNFADALTGGPLAIKMGAPLLLVGDSASEYNYAKNYIKKYKILRGVVLGGPLAVKDATVETIM